MKVNMDMSSYEIEYRLIEDEYSEEIMCSGWNPEVDSANLQLQLVQTGDRLAMPAQPAIGLPLALLEDDDLVVLLLLQHLGRDLGAGDERRADQRARALVEREHLAELDVGASFGDELLDGDHVVLGNAILLSAGADDGIHGTDQNRAERPSV